MDEITTSGLTAEESELLDEALAQAHEEDPNTLPVNSRTLLLDETSSRFNSALWFEEIGKQTVTLAGLGGIGSYVAFLLGRLKIRQLNLFDDDRVDASNLSGQLFSIHDIGITKVSAVSKMLKDYADYYSLIGIPRKFDYNSAATNIMICGFDNMQARNIFYTKWRNYITCVPESERENCLFIDGRLAAEEFQVFCIKGTDRYFMKKYEENWLFNDDEAEETLCSYKQTSYCANMIGSIMVNLFINFVANKCNPITERELPFYTYYNAERMILKTEEV